MIAFNIAGSNFCNHGAWTNLWHATTMLETHWISTEELDESKYYAHVSESRGSVTPPSFDFYCPVGGEFPCLIRHLSSDAVDDDNWGTICLGVSGQPS